MNDFREYQKHPPSQEQPRRKLHPAVLIAAAAVAAVGLIAGTQMLRPDNALSAWWQNAAPNWAHSAPAQTGTAAPAPLAEATCPTCGVVVAVRASKEKGESTAPGAVAGSVVAEKYHVDVKLNDGTTRTFDYPNPPAFASGTPVEVRGDQLVARG